MNKNVFLISISLLIFIIGISCASAANLDTNDSTLSSGIGGGEPTPFYAASLSDSGLGDGGNNESFYLANDLNRPSIVKSQNPQYLGNLSPQWISKDLDRPSRLGYHGKRDPRGNTGTELTYSKRTPRGNTGTSLRSDDRRQRGIKPILQCTESSGSGQIGAELISSEVPTLGGGLGGGGDEHYY